MRTVAWVGFVLVAGCSGTSGVGLASAPDVDASAGAPDAGVVVGEGAVDGSAGGGALDAGSDVVDASPEPTDARVTEAGGDDAAGPDACASPTVSGSPGDSCAPAPPGACPSCLPWGFACAPGVVPSWQSLAEVCAGLAQEDGGTIICCPRPACVHASAVTSCAGGEHGALCSLDDQGAPAASPGLACQSAGGAGAYCCP